MQGKNINLMLKMIMKSMTDILILGPVITVSISAVEEKKYQITRAIGFQRGKMMAG